MTKPALQPKLTIPVEVNIRRATPRDRQACIRLARARELTAPGRRGPELWWITDLLRATTAIFFVAEVSAKIVGFVAGERLASSVALLHLIAVDPRFRGQGIGDGLLRSFERQARRLRLTMVLLYAYALNRHTQHFFRSHGYRPGSTVREFQKTI